MGGNGSRPRDFSALQLRPGSVFTPPQRARHVATSLHAFDVRTATRFNVAPRHRGRLDSVCSRECKSSHRASKSASSANHRRWRNRSWCSRVDPRRVDKTARGDLTSRGRRRFPARSPRESLRSCLTTRRFSTITGRLVRRASNYSIDPHESVRASSAMQSSRDSAGMPTWPSRRHPVVTVSALSPCPVAVDRRPPSWKNSPQT
jgi:hypothetical protein